MGHRLSKTTESGSNVATSKDQRKRTSTKSAAENSQSKANILPSGSSELEQQQQLGPTIKLIADTKHFRFGTGTDSNLASNGGRQIIINIQLAKMEPVENDATSASTLSPDGVTGSDNNLNVERSNLTVNAISFHRNIACDQGNEIKLNNLNVGQSVTLNNNNFVSNFTAVPFIREDGDEARNLSNVHNFNIMVRQMGNVQIVDNAGYSRQGSNNNEAGSNRSSTSSSEFSDVTAEAVEVDSAGIPCSSTTGTKAAPCGEEGKNHCCRRKKSTSASSSGTTALPSTSSSTKWRCCKCTCRDALKKFRPSSSKKQNQHQSSRNSVSDMQSLAAASPSGDHLAIWSPANDVIIPLAPQIVVVQYPPASAASHLVTLGPIANLDEHALRLMTSDLAAPTTPDSPNSMAASPCSTLSTVTTPNGTVVHSQVDYIHCLVPDLERITKSTFYWGKMDRYEAERLLEGKPEGTFLLRDSAQEEYLFSVTFRKYGRSLHARIEQFNHRFSFDCHDPGVFTASTVTGLLEHYKDPSCVMFFEPMLTIPLHRNTTFSLQQLCRATVVSHTTYDGITEMEIPSRLKSYLKEYHYKQRVRVKPFDEPFYSCS